MYTPVRERLARSTPPNNGTRDHAKDYRTPVRDRQAARDAEQYYRIRVRPSENFVRFRTQDVGRSQLVIGMRKSGTWDMQTWLIPKNEARVSGNQLMIDDEIVQDAIKGPITRVKGDLFRARPRPKTER